MITMVNMVFIALIIITRKKCRLKWFNFQQRPCFIYFPIVEVIKTWWTVSFEQFWPF